MSRRTFHRASEAERRQDLIEATLSAIGELGVAGATVRQIAARAGVTGGLIRHYFDGKDQMVQAAYGSVMEGMASAASAALEAAGSDPRARLRAFVTANLSPPIADPRTLSLWAAFIGHVRVDPEFAGIHRDNYLAFLRTLEALLSDFLAGLGRPETAEACRRKAIAINGLLDGLWLEGSLAGDLFAHEELRGIAFDAVESLLGLPPGGLSA